MIVLLESSNGKVHKLPAIYSKTGSRPPLCEPDGDEACAARSSTVLGVARLAIRWRRASRNRSPPRRCSSSSLFAVATRVAGRLARAGLG